MAARRLSGILFVACSLGGMKYQMRGMEILYFVMTGVIEIRGAGPGLKTEKMYEQELQFNP
jgi:hypothetical protein